MLTDEELDEIEELANRASAGPWRAYCIFVLHAEVFGPDAAFGADRINLSRREDAEFIAHARQDVPKLVAEVRKLKNLLFQMQSAAMDLAKQLKEKEM